MADGDASGAFPFSRADARARHHVRERRDARTAIATSALLKSAPQDSAYRVLSVQQIYILIGAVGIVTLFAAANPLTAVVALNAFAATYFLLAAAFRIFLLSVGQRQTNSTPIADPALPIVTVLLPLYKDAAALPALARAIQAFDYPATKKDVKLIIEEDDDATREEAVRLRLDEIFELVLVPPSTPRTKPKACNYGLQLARGALVVIYDAEDQPEPDQLRKAAAAFASGDPTLACVQARLNFYNADDNWLTRLFTLEYSLWFDWLLPGLQRIGAPIPLGGTSNIFRVDALRAVGGWDPYNVTEDADLGLRLSKRGYRVSVLDSTTFEEANCRFGNWVRQRSRWMKGYLQTWLVHMRAPGAFVRTTGWRGLLAVQLFLAGNVFSALINPTLLALTLFWLLAAPFNDSVLPMSLIALNTIALVFGNAFFVFLAVIAPLKRGWGRLSLWGLSAPFYWMLASVGAYKALWQLMTRPHFWEKTDHVISEAAQQKRRDALRDGPVDAWRAPPVDLYAADRQRSCGHERV